MEFPLRVAGRFTGVAFPTSVDALRDAGPAFLTEAFQVTGALAGDNHVVSITGWKEFFGGGMGRKIKLDVEYARPDPGLHTRLFVKFTREFGDPLRELFSPVMEPEVAFALLSRRPDFPVRVPACYFGDYNVEHKSGLLITECIPYGEQGIEPALDKCLDYMIENPLDHYTAQAHAIAALAAYHRAGHFGPEIEEQFPFHRVTKLVPYDAAQLSAMLGKLRHFAATAPQLLPDSIRSEPFLSDFCRDALVLLEKESRILDHLNGQADLIALCHWNMNPDNAWFWRDETGMHSGQLDWGGVQQMNMAQAFYGLTCAAETDFIERHEASLIAIVLKEYRALGGPEIDPATFVLSLRLSMAVLGVAWMLDAPSLIEAEVPDVAALKDRYDPEIRDRFIPRAQLQLMVVFLNEWRRNDIGAIIRAF